jgi:dCTP deaminase
LNKQRRSLVFRSGIAGREDIPKYEVSMKSVGLFPELTASDELLHTTGILPSQTIRRLIASGRINSPVEIAEEQIQPASIDLRLGSVAYRVRASFLPGPQYTVENKIRDLLIAEVDLTKPTVFERGCVFIVPLLEELSLTADTAAKANPKSTTGRLDVFTRLITDYGTEFDWASRGYSGKLYAEIISRTFAVTVVVGTKLNQLRFIRGNPPSTDGMLAELDRKETLVYETEDSPVAANIDRGLRISVDLSGTVDKDIVAHRAKRNAPVVDLTKKNFYDPSEFWEPIYAPGPKGIILDPGDFYLLASREKVRVPPTFAAEMVAYDPTIGELRIHYAGFFDPGFGYGLSDIPGTKAVLEVRAHEVPVLLEDRQVIGRLLYSRMMGSPDKVYGTSIGSAYQRQGLMLSKQFKRP